MKLLRIDPEARFTAVLWLALLRQANGRRTFAGLIRYWMYSGFIGAFKPDWILLLEQSSNGVVCGLRLQIKK